MEEKISIILVNYNGKDYNNKCICSILNSTIKDHLQIVVVDNASTDNSLTDLKEYWGGNEQVFIIELNQNYGFSKANNEGIKWSIENGINYFLLLNNDTEIKPDTIAKMWEVQKEKKSIVVPKVLYADRPDTIWCAGGEFTHFIKKPRQRGINQKDEGQFDKSGVCGFANGCCLFLSKEITDRIGLLDERFFLYYEDTEYSLRAQENDVNVWYCPEAVVYHKVNGSTKGNERPANAYYITRNWLMCSRMHMGKRFYAFFTYFLLNRLAWIVIWSLQGRYSMVREVIKGISAFFRGISGKRKE